MWTKGDLFIAATKKEADSVAKLSCRELFFHMKTLITHRKEQPFPQNGFLGMNPANFEGLNVQVEATRTRRQRLCPLEHILQSDKSIGTSTDQH